MRKILLVDDEVIIATQLEEYLAHLGYDIVGMASSGREAVDSARRLRPDLVLMDIVMPGDMDGLAAAGHIRDELGIPFIFLTAYADHDLLARAKRLGPLGYILKPFQEGQVAAAVEIALHNHRIAQRLRESEDRYRGLVEIIPHGIVETDTDFVITFANPAFHAMHGYDRGGLEGMRLYELMAWEEEAREVSAALPSLLRSEPPASTWVWRNRTRSEGTVDVQMDWDYKRNAEGRVIGFIHVVTDITERLRAETTLRQAHDELEERVQRRTEDLLRANTQLKEEIQERTRAEEELQVKRANLEEVNTALKVLLKKRDENRLELEENVLINIKELAFPYLEKLRGTFLTQTQAAYLGILESNLNDVVSPLSKKLSSRFWNFTPAEIKISNLVKHGKTTKEIALLLNLSPKTIETHRKNIRKKLGIGGKKANLRSQLLPLE